jgi:retron-type reverse transcriptase
MGAVFEQDFLPISYGFREGRNAHDALAFIREQCMTRGIRWIYDADITGFLDPVSCTGYMVRDRSKTTDARELLFGEVRR